MKKRLMAVLLCVCMAAVLLTPYASVLTADGALRLGIAGAENGQDLTGESSSTPTEGGEEAESAETLKEEAPEATATAEPEATATTAPEATATTAPEATKAQAPKYTLDSNRAVYKDGATLRGEPKDCVVKASYSVAQAYKGPTDRSEAKTYKAGDRVRVCDEIRYEDRDGIEREWSVVLDGGDFYFVLSKALEPAPELPAQTPAQTDMKSLFGIGDNVNPASINPGDTKVATYNFYNGPVLVQSESVQNGGSLKEPEVPATVEGQTFDGWYTAAEGGEKFTSFGTPLTVTETTTINLYARFRTVYHVNFYTPDGKKHMFTKEVSDHEEHDFSDLSYDVGSNSKVTGWAADINGTADISKNIKVPEGQTSVSVYAIETKGYWVVFDTQGGTSVAPVFKAAGETLNLSTVTNPIRTGYKFDGWYNNKDCTGSAVTTVSDAATLYAKWEPQIANLTVIFWYENADDDGYSYKDSKTVTATTGSEVRSGDYSSEKFSGRDDNHFTINTDKVDTVTVAGDGSSKLNVYFKRNQYTLTFTTGEEERICGKVAHEHRYALINSCYNWKGELTCKKEEHAHTDSCYSSGVVKTITAKYQADIHSNFPIKDGNETIWWTVPSGCQSFEPDNYLGSIDTMPGENITFTKHASETGAKIYYYVETLNGAPGNTTYKGKNYKTYKVIDLEYSSKTRLTYAEEFHPITGFTQGDSDPKLPEGGSVPMKKKNDLFYTRNSYDLKFFNHNAELKDKQATVQYEALLKGHLITPDYPAGLEKGLYAFEGWYFDQYFKNKVEDTSTMPAADVMLYAHWVPKEFTVSFNLGYENAPAVPEQTVPAKGKAMQPADPAREGWRFMGWYDGNEPFSFETEIVKDTALTAKWLLEGNVITVKYDLNGGGGTAPTDNTPYADGAGAVVKNKTEDMTPPADTDTVFLGWATTPGGTAKYLPGGTMTIDANMANEERKITLYAVWGEKPATTTLTYNANYDGADPMTKPHKLGDSTDLPNNATVTLYDKNTFTRPGGYELDGWAKDADATEPDYKCGDPVIVDTINQATANILYAVWKRSTTTVTVTKVVTGNFADKTKTFAFQYKKDGEENWTDATPLSDGDRFTIDNVTLGSTLLIREMPEGYTPSVGSDSTGISEGHLTGSDTHDSYYTAIITGVVAGEEITFTNTKDGIPDTGVILDSLPYVLILAVVALGMAGVVIRRRRSREDD